MIYSFVITSNVQYIFQVYDIRFDKLQMCMLIDNALLVIRKNTV